MSSSSYRWKRSSAGLYLQRHAMEHSWQIKVRSTYGSYPISPKRGGGSPHKRQLCCGGVWLICSVWYWWGRGLLQWGHIDGRRVFGMGDWIRKVWPLRRLGYVGQKHVSWRGSRRSSVWRCCDGFGSYCLVRVGYRRRIVWGCCLKKGGLTV